MDLQNNRLLITGAAGFIGRAVLDVLSSTNWNVYACDRNAASDVSGVTFYELDLKDTLAVRQTLSYVKPDVLLHLAWLERSRGHIGNPRNIEWAAISYLLYQAFLDVGGKRAVFAGSCAEYDWSFNFLSEQTTPTRPHSVYGRAKHMLHDMVEQTPSVAGSTYAWARLFFLYGPYDPPNRLFSDVFSSLAKDRPVECSPGNQERDYMHVKDAARALVLLLSSEFQGAVNIATGECHKIRNLLEMVGAITGKRELIRLGARASSPGEPWRLAADVSKLNGILGFHPKFDIRSGLENTWSWWRERCSPAVTPSAG